MTRNNNNCKLKYIAEVNRIQNVTINSAALMINIHIEVSGQYSSNQYRLMCDIKLSDITERKHIG